MNAKENKLKAKHTPGPWSIREGEGKDNTKWIDGNDGLVLAYVSDKNLKDTSLRDANAQLIAAAPELLEALKEVHKYLCDDYQTAEKLRDIFLLIEPAIAKAEGK